MSAWLPTEVLPMLWEIFGGERAALDNPPSTVDDFFDRVTDWSKAAGVGMPILARLWHAAVGAQRLDVVEAMLRALRYPDPQMHEHMVREHTTYQDIQCEVIGELLHEQLDDMLVAHWPFVTANLRDEEIRTQHNTPMAWVALYHGCLKFADMIGKPTGGSAEDEFPRAVEQLCQAYVNARDPKWLSVMERAIEWGGWVDGPQLDNEHIVSVMAVGHTCTPRPLEVAIETYEWDQGTLMELLMRAGANHKAASTLMCDASVLSWTLGCAVNGAGAELERLGRQRDDRRALTCALMEQQQILEYRADRRM